MFAEIREIINQCLCTDIVNAATLLYATGKLEEIWSTLTSVPEPKPFCAFIRVIFIKNDINACAWGI